MLSIIVPWYNRFELEIAIPSIISAAEELRGEVIIINLGGDSELLLKQVENHKRKLKIVKTENKKTFNKPMAQNIGASEARYPYLFFCDCDIILSQGTLKDLFDCIKNNHNQFGTLSGVKETKINARNANNLVMFGYELCLKIADGTEVKIVDNEEDTEKGIRQAPGLLMVKKSDFEKINGYNSQLDGWGWEDQDMICRLTLGAKLKRVSLGIAQHISHTDEARMQGYQKYSNRWESRDKMFRLALQNYDNGLFLGSYGDDVNKFKKTYVK